MGWSPMIPLGSSLDLAPEYWTLASVGSGCAGLLVLWAYVRPFTFALGRFPVWSCWCNALPFFSVQEWGWLAGCTCPGDGQTPRS